MMRMVILPLVLAFICVLTGFSHVFAVEQLLFKARISDVDGRPVEGAKLFIYDNSSIRRAADYISGLSDRAGRIQIVLPPGKYWMVARYKSDRKYGPLLPGDKHSGEPLEIELSDNGSDADFVVANIRELGQKKRANATDALRLKGRVVDRVGSPVKHVFVFAGRSKEFPELPDYISAWTGEDGEYELYLPPAELYYIGASKHLPLEFKDRFITPVALERGKIDIALDINFTVE